MCVVARTKAVVNVNNAHSVREFIPVRNLELTVDLLERLVAKFASVPAEG